jgi:hypothetical protein
MTRFYHNDHVRQAMGYDDLSPEERAEMEAAFGAMDAADSRLPSPEEVLENAKRLGLDAVPF